MKFKTLNDRLRKRILNGELKASQLSGEALTYFKKVEALKKARKAKKKIGKKSTKRKSKLVIPKGSELERIVKGSAKQKKMSVAKFLKKHKKEVEALAKNGTIYLTREADYVQDDIGKAQGVEVDGEKMSKTKAKFFLSEFKRLFVIEGQVYPIINIEFGITLKGIIKIDFPLPDDYDGLSSPDEWRDLVSSNFPHIFWIPNS